MKKFIVLTSVQDPTPATIKFSEMTGWTLIVVGDLKTPHDKYIQLEKAGKLIYLTPDYQEKTYPALSFALGWNLSPRRNIGFIEAYRRGCDLLAHVDDDNMPYDDWGQDIIIGKETQIDYYETNNKVFDPLSVTNESHLWHRGFPLDLVKVKGNVKYAGKIKAKILVQANLWNGNPDVDAIERLIYSSEVTFDVKDYYTSNAPFSPFNSQNTIMAREVIPYFMLLTHIGRIDDIWGSYQAQKFLYKGSPIVAYGKPTVYQNRNTHNLLDDFDKEVLGYTTGEKILDNMGLLLPGLASRCFDIYRSYF